MSNTSNVVFGVDAVTDGVPEIENFPFVLVLVF